MVARVASKLHELLLGIASDLDVSAGMQVACRGRRTGIQRCRTPINYLIDVVDRKAPFGGPLQDGRRGAGGPMNPQATVGALACAR